MLRAGFKTVAPPRRRRYARDEKIERLDGWTLGLKRRRKFVGGLCESVILSRACGPGTTPQMPTNAVGAYSGGRSVCLPRPNRAGAIAVQLRGASTAEQARRFCRGARITIRTSAKAERAYQCRAWRDRIELPFRNPPGSAAATARRGEQ